MSDLTPKPERERQITAELTQLRSGPSLTAGQKKTFVQLLLELKELRDHANELSRQIKTKRNTAAGTLKTH